MPVSHRAAGLPHLARRVANAGALAAIAAALAVAMLTAPPASAAPAGTTQYVLQPSGPAADDIFPEGVAVRGSSFYVSSTTDGTIYRGWLGGRTARPFVLGSDYGSSSAIGLDANDDVLVVAGGAQGTAYVLDRRTGSLVAAYDNGVEGATFVNDAVIGPDGDVYLTDSFRPVLYRIPASSYAGGHDRFQPLEEFVDYSAAGFVPGEFNANGIEVIPNGPYLLVVNSTTGTLFRVTTDGTDLALVDLDGAVHGDGLELSGRTLYAVERLGDEGFVTQVHLSVDFTDGRIVQRLTDPTFDDPTTAALARGRLLVVNSQFGERAAGEEPDTFTVSSLELP